MFTELGAYCQSLPRLNLYIRKGTHIATMQVITRSYPFYQFFYELFYPLVDGYRIKLIPMKFIYLLDPLALSIWAMDDGSHAQSGFYFHTKGFTEVDVIQLFGILHYNFGLICNMQSHKGQPVIYVTAASMPLLRSILAPHILPEFAYKIRLYK